MKGLLAVSFGTSHADAREKTIDAVDALLAQAFPDRAFYTAWTSGRIVAKVRRERGEHHDLLDEAFARMDADGIDDVVVTSLCLMDGHETRKIRDAAEAWAAERAGRVARVADPLLFTEADRVAVAQAVCDEFGSIVGDDEALLLMGHGSPYAPNDIYTQIQDAFDALGFARFIVATVEGEPVFEDALARIDELGVARVRLAPLLIVAGDHAKNDLAGDDEDSWKNQLEARGMQVSVTLKGLGEYAAVRKLVVEHALAASVDV